MTQQTDIERVNWITWRAALALRTHYGPNRIIGPTVRQIGSLWAYRNTHMSISEICRGVRACDYNSVVPSIRCAKRRIKTDPLFQEMYSRIDGWVAEFEAEQAE